MVKELSQSRLELADIVNTSYMEAMVDTFFEDVKLASGILDEDARPVTLERNHCDFCKEIRKTRAGVELCRESDRCGIELAKEHLEKTGRAEPVFYVCKHGLVDCCAPIVADGEIVAYFFTGQLKCSCEDLLTSEESTLGNLRAYAEVTGEKPDTAALESEFRKLQVIDVKEFARLENIVTDLAHQLNSVVRKIHAWSRVEVIDDFRRKALDIQTVKELFDLTIERLPEMMGAEQCSIFTVYRDENGDERLVLRRTSYGALKPKENSAYYEKGEGLTGWVWQRGRSLRLMNLQDAAELAQYPSLQWEQKHNDSDDHMGFLCVPMLGPNRQVAGVIRVPHKKGGVPFFKRDEIFLTFLGRYLSWVMEYQAGEEKFGHAVGPMGLVNAATQLFSARSYREVLDAAIESSLVLFGGEDKKHFVNILERDKERWKIERIQGALDVLGLDAEWKGRRFHVSEGITGLAIRTGKACLSSHLEESLGRGEYIEAVAGGESAISAPIRWGKKVYGALSIVSSKRFEFCEERELRLLGALGNLTGAAIRGIEERWLRKIVIALWEIIKVWKRLKRE